MEKPEIYLDNAATTRVCAEAADIAYKVMTDCYGNPSSTHAKGREAKAYLDTARAQIASALGCSASEVYFTSCGSESDVWAITRGAESAARRGRHIISSAVEHDAVRKTLEELESRGFEVTYLSPEKDGSVSVDEMLSFAEQAEREYAAEAAAFVQTPADIVEQSRAVREDSFSIYQLKRGDETLDYRFEPLDAIRRNGLSVDPANYELVYTAPLTERDDLESIYTRFNIDRPADFKGHSLSVSDIVVLHQGGSDTAYYCDRFGFSQVPEFLEPDRAKEVTIPTPDQMATRERISTPRGSFTVTAMSREQMEAAGYGLHHQSDDGKYLIMGNGTRAFAVLAEQPEKDNPLRAAEMTLEDDYGMIDGIINNGRRGEELEKAQEHTERTQPEKKLSIRERLENARQECAKQKAPEIRKPGRDVPEHGDL